MTGASGPRKKTRREKTPGVGVVLGISAGAKASGAKGERSAINSYLTFMLERIAPFHPKMRMLDLAKTPLPFFDGRRPSEVKDENLIACHSAVQEAAAILLAVPAYWQAVGGVFKNFCDVLAGPAYDLDGAPTVFHDKQVGLLVVGADAASASHGTRDAERIMTALGARLLAPSVAVSNPRHLKDEAELAAFSHKLIGLAGKAALAARSRLPDPSIEAAQEPI